MRKKVCRVESILLIAFFFSILMVSFVSASDVAYIYNKNFKIDNNIKALFSELNLTVDMIQEKDVLKTDFSTYKFIFVGDERFTSPKKLPIGKYPTVVTNYYHGYDWGLTDNDGISKLGRTEPMSVRINDSIIQVYTEGVYDSSSVAIPYYYLGTKDKAASMSKVAGTYSGNGHDLGDVISYSHAGSLLLNGKYTNGNICFFGIVSSEYWTDDAKEMFLRCLSFVGSECSTDTDCGEDTTGDKYCMNSSVYQNTSNYYCTNPATIEAKCLSHTTVHHIEDCNFGCSNGECLPECSNDSDCDDSNTNTEDTCLNPGTKNSTCVHNPILCFNNATCGTNGFVGDLFCQNNNSIFQNYITFTCNNPGTAASTCSNSTTAQLKSTCLINQVCREGACLNVICRTDSECNDSNENTQDICKNPGTPESYCEHKAISCKKNLDCGTDGLFGPNFCIDNSVYQNFSVFTCTSPGTFNSVCSSSNTPQLKQACLQNQKCQNGMCVNVNCNLDSDCGQNGLLNQLSCKSDNLFDKYLTYKCNSPGTTASYCSNSTEDRMVTDCADKCYNNQCVNITCYNNGQCNDNNSNTEDTCKNPGTPESYCDHEVIHCQRNTDCGTNGFSENSYCFNQNSFEDFISYTCNNPGTAQSYCSNAKMPIISEYCDFDCVSGKCIGCFNDLSCGTAKYIGDKYCEGNKVYQDYQDFMCTSPGTPDSTCMSSITPKLISECDGLCFKGQCSEITCSHDVDCNDNNVSTRDQCNNPGTGSSYCTNTKLNCVSNNDCGVTGFIGSEFCVGTNVFKNFQNSTCKNPGTINSYCSVFVNSNLVNSCGDNYCDSWGQNTCKNGNVYHSRTCYNKGCATGKCVTSTFVEEESLEICSYGCTNGQCINVRCSSNSQCDDSNENTQDICINPGTSQSSCQHNFITCSNNNQCGQNGFTGDLFCMNNGVYQNFKAFTCNNPGTVTSYCSSSSNPQLKSSCSTGQTCSNGMCVNVVCNSDSNCDDSNPMTADTCVFPGTTQSYCAHNPISCNSNAQCGQNGFTGDLFCQGSNSFQNFITYTCNNPGTIQSSCSNTIIPQLKQTCSYGCTSGVCNQNNCVDNDHDSYDTCSSGTPGDDGKPVDCNDNNPNVHPNAVEVCNGIDDDCDSLIDEGSSICGSNQVCQSGNCVPVACSLNSQCGTNGLLNQLTCKDGNVFDKFRTYTCNNPGTAQSHCTSATTDQLKQTCSYGCTNGMCNQNNCVDNDHDSYDTCSSGTPGDDGKPVDCNDNNPNVHPNAVEVCNGIDDDCDGLIDEGSSLCGNNQVCQNGMCTPITCYNDIDCNDNNAMTSDSCINPGTTTSYCIHNPINCNSNTQCGTNKFLNQLTCKDGNVFDKYITFTCNNPGSTSSYCSNSVTDKVKVLCTSGQVCSNGACVPVACSDDTDCNDNDQTTIDKCNYPGTAQSYCSHNPVNCNSNSQCGTNGYFGNNFCQGDDVFQNYITYTCVSPGTENSHCTNSTVAKIKSDCDDSTQVCSNGQCTNKNIPCSTNSQCGTNGYIGNKFCQDGDSYQDYLSFKCNNPGAVNSYCTNLTTAKIKQDCNDDTQVCSNGLCTNANIKCSLNSECGNNGFLNQLSCKNGSVFDKYRVFTCNNPATINSYCSNSTTDQLKQTCSLGCTNGVCNSNTCVDHDYDSYDTCNPGTPGDDGKPVDCNDNNPNVHPNAVEVCNGIDDDCDGLIDEGSSICGSNQVCSSGICVPVICNKNSDCGQNAFINGLFCQNKNVFQNFVTYTCNNPGTIQSSCSASVAPVLNKTCSQNQICSNGECTNLNIPCSTDSQCDDSNTHTYDKCNNPATPQSFCSHTPIVCLNNLECGTNGFIDGLFCQNNNVFQNFVTYTCTSPGTIQSSCNAVSAPQLKTTCSQNQVCSNGMCSNILCNQNSDCGTDHDLNQLTCKNGNVFDTHITFTCNNPGTQGSTCSNATSDVLKQTCSAGQTCQNGSCVTIVCSSDSDCGQNAFLNQPFCKDGNIFDKYLKYTCNNPGTITSYCSNAVEDKVKQTCSSGQLCSTGTAFNPENGETFTIGNNLDEIYNFVKSKDSSIGNCPLSGNGNALMLAKVGWSTGSCSPLAKSQLDQTATKICNLAGYKDPNTYDSLYNADGGRCNYFTPYDDCIWYWTGSNWQYSNSNNGANKFGERWITKLTCINRLPGPGDTGVTAPQCKNVACSSDSDCNDNNAGTKDKCVNPGTVNSVCTHTQCPTGGQNSNYPSPYQCGGADWNIGLPNGVTCTGSVTTIGALEEDSKATLVTGNTNRLRPDLTTMNKFCQGYTGQANSYATYGRMHNYCNGCDQRLAWFENNQWNSQGVCWGTLNVQLVTCATGCTAVC